MKIAIIGSGIAGNVVARRLHPRHAVTVFEAAAHIGGHTHTHDVQIDGERQQIDTGFIVFNDWTYPNFIALLDELGVESQPSAMSFSVRNEASGLEYKRQHAEHAVCAAAQFLQSLLLPPDPQHPAF